MTRRGTRIVTGYVVSLSGKRGGPYHQAFNGGKYRTTDAKSAENSCAYVRRMHPSARVLPVVRYELDREEERLRDAVVEAALKETAQADLIREQVSAFHAHDVETWDESQYAVACEAHREAKGERHRATRALRAHLEKSK